MVRIVLRQYICRCGGTYIANVPYIAFRRCIYCGRRIVLKRRKKAKRPSV